MTYIVLITAIFTGIPKLAGCPLYYLTRGLGDKLRSFMGRIPFVTPASRNTLGFTFSASTTTFKGKGHHFFCVLSLTPVLQVNKTKKRKEKVNKYKCCPHRYASLQLWTLYARTFVRLWVLVYGDTSDCHAKLAENWQN